MLLVPALKQQRRPFGGTQSLSIPMPQMKQLHYQPISLQELPEIPNYFYKKKLNYKKRLIHGLVVMQKV
jgi:hypothetical protein